MQKKSIYKYAAEAGVPVGLYLSFMSACFLLSIKVNFLSLLNIPLLICFPFFLGYIINKIGKQEPGFKKFSSLWLGGIYSVIFGTLICMLFTALYLMYVDPGFMQTVYNSMVTTLEQSEYSGEFALYLENLKRMKEAHMLPGPMDFVITMGWFTTFSGSMLSLFIALIISRKSRKITNAIS